MKNEKVEKVFVSFFDFKNATVIKRKYKVEFDRVSFLAAFTV